MASVDYFITPKICLITSPRKSCNVKCKLREIKINNNCSIPLLHSLPLHPATHPLSHWPVTWLQTTLSLQCPEHCCLQSRPYQPLHSFSKIKHYVMKIESWFCKSNQLILTEKIHVLYFDAIWPLKLGSFVSWLVSNFSNDFAICLRLKILDSFVFIPAYPNF